MLLAAGVSSARDAQAQEEALLVPVVLAVMHFGHGAGFLRGAFRHGPPLAAVLSVLGLSAAARKRWPAPSAVFAPSLDGRGPDDFSRGSARSQPASSR